MLLNRVSDVRCMFPTHALRPETSQRTLCFASIVLVALSLYQAVDKTRRGDSGCLGHVLTLINGCIVGSWVGIGWLRRGAEIQSPTDWLSLLAIALSLFQLALWSTSIGPPGDKSDFPADIILVVVAILSSSAMNASLKTADCAFRASDGLARRVSASVMQN